MKIIGEPIFARTGEGLLISRIGTLFLKTPGLVTQKTVHALQRLTWIDDINAARAERGEKPLTEAEEEAEIAESVDLIFTDELVLIRPDPDRMDLAFRADEILQTLVSKRVIRFLNTNSQKVRRALCQRGENWRMARQPISQDDMTHLIVTSRVAVGERPIYYYNHATGTRYVTASAYDEIERLPLDDFRRQVAEIVHGLGKFNKTGHPEVDIFPTTTPIEIKKALKALDAEQADESTLRAACAQIARDWRMSLPAEFREETPTNFAWRNAMCRALTEVPNETAAEEQELVAGIASEFYRQIEWLPGARVERGEVIFDAVYDEATRTQDPDLLALCDTRVKSILFNVTRLFGNIAYINIGRIANSLARHPIASNRRGNVYIMQYQADDETTPHVRIIRLQKWGVAERLDEGKNLLQAIVESDEYSDYILDRRLMCRQLGMNLPKHLGCGHFTEKYRGRNASNGISVRTAYFVRDYVAGIASDKIPMARFRNPLFALRFASLMGDAAAIDLVVGRRSSVTNEPLFDQNYEVVRLGADGLPAEIRVTDHAGSFVEYEHPYESYVADYAHVVLRRREAVADYTAFTEAYVAGFQTRLTALQTLCRARRRAFTELFRDRPYDTNGSGAYRWSCALKRLDACNPASVAQALRLAIAK